MENSKKVDLYASELSYNERKELETKQLMAYRYEQGVEIGEEKGLSKGKLQAKIEMASSLIIDGFSDEMIAKHTKLPLNEIEKLKKELSK